MVLGELDLTMVFNDCWKLQNYEEINMFADPFPQHVLIAIVVFFSLFSNKVCVCYQSRCIFN